MGNLIRLFFFFLVAAIVIGVIILFGLFFLPLLLILAIFLPFFSRPRIIFRTGAPPPPEPDDKYEPDGDVPANEAVIDVVAVEIPAEKHQISDDRD